MGKLVNSESDRDVDAFIDAVKNSQRREDSKRLLAVMKELTGKEPKIWGDRIVAFSKYKYKRKDGKEFEWFNVGFSPASKHMTVTLMFDLDKEPLLKKLGSHSNGRGCLYIKKLDDVNMDVLKELILKSDRWQHAE